MSFKDCLNRAALRGMIKENRLADALEMYDAMEREFINAGIPPELAARQAAERVTDAAKRDVLRKKQLAVLSHSAKQRMDADMEAYRTAGGEKNYIEALENKIENDGTAAFQGARNLQKTYTSRFHNMINDFLAEYGKGFGVASRKLEGLDDVGRALFSEKIENKSAQEMADAVSKTFEYARTTANSLGADIGKKERYGLPQNHNILKVKKAGRDEWVRKVMSALDFSLMRDDAGRSLSTMGMQEKVDVLKKVYETIVTDGYIKKPKTNTGRSGLANSLGQKRFLEFNNFDSWSKYNNEFGDGDVFSIIVNHLDEMAHNISMLSVFGPNPEAMFRYAKETALNKAATDDIAEGGGLSAMRTIKQKIQERTLDSAWGMQNMQNGVLTNDRVGFTFAGIRNLLTAAQLGSAALAAIPGDMVTVKMAKAISKLPVNNFMENYLKNWSNGGTRQLAVRLGLIAEAATAIAGAHNRYVGDLFGPEWTRRVSDTVMRASGMTGHTQAARWAHGMEWLGYFADAKSKAFKDLEVVDALGRAGITEDDWKEFAKTDLYEHEGATFLRPDDVLERTDITPEKARALADKFQTFVLDEMHRAVPDSSIRSRAFLLGDSKPGTLSGELLRSFAMYKNFPVTLTMMMNRGMMMQSGISSRLGFAVTYGLMLTAVGGLTVQMQQLAKGRDPISMNPSSKYGRNFWGQAALTGGGMGIWGDFLFRDVNRFGGGIGQTLAGPMAGLAEDTLKLTVGNVLQFADGKDTNIKAEGLNYARRYLPGGNIWYGRAVLQNGIFDAIQKEVDPDAYVKWQRQKSSYFNDYGQKSWWDRGNIAPARAPDFGKIAQ
jgi:hypothetical protein